MGSNTETSANKENELLLSVRNLTAGIEDKEILHGINLDVRPGEIHVLMGPNGAGKSTFGCALMGHPRYQTSSDGIFLCGEDISGLSTDKRAKKGLFMTFQNPIEVPGLTVEAFIRASLREITGKNIKVFAFRRKLQEMMERLNMDPAYAERELNVGFSGGERKKNEILQMLMLEPKLAVLDETDSGLDVDAVRTVSKGVEFYHEQNPEASFVIITHSTRILESLKVDKVHVLVKGQIVESGSDELIDEINEKGFERFEEK